jgi:hypothetical protein
MQKLSSHSMGQGLRSFPTTTSTMSFCAYIVLSIARGGISEGTSDNAPWAINLRNIPRRLPCKVRRRCHTLLFWTSKESLIVE